MNINLARFLTPSMLMLASALPVSGYGQGSTVYTLEQAIEFALDNNPDLQIMQDRIAQSEAQLGMALAAFYPNISTDLYYEHSDNPSRAFAMVISQRQLDFSPGVDFNHPGGVDNYRPQVTARYNLFHGGQDYFQTQAAELGVEAAQLQKSAYRNRLIEMITSSFYAYLAALEADKVAQKSIEAVNSELEQSRIRYEAGSLLRSDVLSLEVQLAKAKDHKFQTANAIELTQTGIGNLLGLSTSEPLELNGQENWQLPAASDHFEALRQQALEQRPENLAAQKQIEIAEQQLKAAQGAFLPRADAYVTYGSDSKDLDFNTNQDNVTAGVQIELDIFSGFSTQESLKKAEQQLAIAQKTARKVELEIESTVKTAYLKKQEALARVNVTSSSVEAAEEALRLVHEQRKAGTVTVTRYLEAEVARDKAHAGYIAARFDALRAQAELNQALGVWK